MRAEYGGEWMMCAFCEGGECERGEVGGCERVEGEVVGDSERVVVERCGWEGVIVVMTAWRRSCEVGSVL